MECPQSLSLAQNFLNRAEGSPVNGVPVRDSTGSAHSGASATAFPYATPPAPRQSTGLTGAQAIMA